MQHFPPLEVVASRIDGILAFDRSAELGRIRTPTLVLCAKDDAITPAYFSEELAKKIAGRQAADHCEGGHCASETIAEVQQGRARLPRAEIRNGRSRSSSSFRGSRSAASMRCSRLSLVIINKATDVVNFAQGEMAMIGTFAALAVAGRAPLPLWLVMLGGVPARHAVRRAGRTHGHAAARRQPPINALIATIGLWILFHHVAGWIWGYDPVPLSVAFLSRAGGCRRRAHLAGEHWHPRRLVGS